MNVNLQHPVPIAIRQLLRGVAEQDDDYRETVQGGAFGDSIVCRGQIKWGAEKSFDITRLGTQDASDGYVVFRTIDLRAVGITELQIGDKLSTFGVGNNQLDREVYVIILTPFAHYPDQGGAACIKAFFSDRQPARGT